jgi:hypothetical protein
MAARFKVPVVVAANSLRNFRSTSGAMLETIDAAADAATITAPVPPGDQR